MTKAKPSDKPTPPSPDDTSMTPDPNAPCASEDIDPQAAAFLDGHTPPPCTAVVNVGGRPSTYTKELAMQVCDEIADGKSLRAICNTEGMPHKGTVLRWIRDNPDFRELYRDAMSWRAETHCDEIIEIADDATDDIVVDAEGKISPNTKKTIARATLAIESRKWVMAKQMPRRYGERPDDIFGPFMLMAPAAAAAAPAAATNGENAKVIEGVAATIEEDPLYESILALDRAIAVSAAEKAKAEKK